MRPTTVRLLGGVVEIHPFKHLCATNSSARYPTLIIRGKAIRQGPWQVSQLRLRVTGKSARCH